MWLIEKLDWETRRRVPVAVAGQSERGMAERYVARLEALRLELIATRDSSLVRERNIHPQHYWLFANPSFLETASFKIAAILPLDKTFVPLEEEEASDE